MSEQHTDQPEHVCLDNDPFLNEMVQRIDAWLVENPLHARGIRLAQILAMSELFHDTKGLQERLGSLIATVLARFSNLLITAEAYPEEFDKQWEFFKPHIQQQQGNLWEIDEAEKPEYRTHYPDAEYRSAQ